MALSDILFTEADVVDTVFGDVVSGPQSIGVNRKLEKYLAAFHQKPAFGVVNHLGAVFGVLLDISDKNPKKFANNIKKYRRRHPVCEYVLAAIERCDVVVINGEGDMIFTTPPRRQFLFLLAVMEISIELKKPFFYVNGMASDCPRSGRNIETFGYAAEAFAGNGKPIFMRERTSVKIIEEMNTGCNVDCVPDALFTWQHMHQGRGNDLIGIKDYIVPFPEFSWTQKAFSLGGDYICVSGSSSAAWDQRKAFLSYRNLVKELSQKFKNVVLMEACRGDRFLRDIASECSLPLIPVQTGIHVVAEILSNARTFISGRYHPSILASLGGTPCVFLGSNAHKTASLQMLLGYSEIMEFPDHPATGDYGGIIAMAERNICDGGVLRGRIASHVFQLAVEAKSIGRRIGL